MTIAELRGKLSPDREGGVYERLEDLLTSDVFGTMQYLGGGSGFASWLASAVRPASQGGVVSRLGDIVPPDKIHSIRFAFWPTLRNGREPDVALLIEMDDAQAILVFIEAKYFSGMSDSEVPGDLDDRGRTGNQIVDQVRGAMDIGHEELSRWFDWSGSVSICDMIHLLVTRDTRLPSDIYEDANRQLAAPWPIQPFWLSWTSLRAYLEPYRHHGDPGPSALVEDLIKLLEHKDLVPFAGFQLVAWRGAVTMPRFWREEWWCNAAFTPNTPVRFWMSP
jgi:hypothetical protein